eukprot:GHVN01072807.1.p1 GENE.GHVN01072807.1~~GHVN01072807.1.p1  ORF type:complete len:642 (+),score=88.03 GHVN01072807.1:240-2165(+)
MRAPWLVFLVLIGIFFALLVVSWIRITPRSSSVELRHRGHPFMLSFDNRSVKAPDSQSHTSTQRFDNRSVKAPLELLADSSNVFQSKIDSQCFNAASPWRDYIKLHEEAISGHGMSCDGSNQTRIAFFRDAPNTRGAGLGDIYKSLGEAMVGALRTRRALMIRHDRLAPLSVVFDENYVRWDFHKAANKTQMLIQEYCPQESKEFECPKNATEHIHIETKDVTCYTDTDSCNLTDTNNYYLETGLHISSCSLWKTKQGKEWNDLFESLYLDYQKYKTNRFICMFHIFFKWTDKLREMIDRFSHKTFEGIAVRHLAPFPQPAAKPIPLPIPLPTRSSNVPHQHQSPHSTPHTNDTTFNETFSLNQMLRRSRRGELTVIGVHLRFSSSLKWRDVNIPHHKRVSANQVGKSIRCGIRLGRAMVKKAKSKCKARDETKKNLKNCVDDAYPYGKPRLILLLMSDSIEMRSAALEFNFMNQDKTGPNEWKVNEVRGDEEVLIDEAAKWSWNPPSLVDQARVDLRGYCPYDSFSSCHLVIPRSSISQEDNTAWHVARSQHEKSDRELHLLHTYAEMGFMSAVSDGLVLSRSGYSSMIGAISMIEAENIRFLDITSPDLCSAKHGIRSWPPRVNRMELRPNEFISKGHH